MKKSNDPNKYPKGWDAAKTRQLAAFYDEQTGAEVAAEDEAVFGKTETLVRVPARLLPAVRRLIAKPARSAARSGAR